MPAPKRTVVGTQTKRLADGRTVTVTFYRKQRRTRAPKKTTPKGGK